jgi:hypothetical protein
MSTTADAAPDHLDTPGTTDSSEHPSAEASSVEREPQSSAPSEPRSDDDLDTELLSDEQVDALKNDPTLIGKAYQRAFTQKTQKLAALRKELEPFKDLIAAYRDDPKATIATLARQAGFEVSTPDEHAATASDPPKSVQELLAESLGPEYEDLSERMGPVLEKAIQAEARRITAPLLEVQTKQLQESALREVNAEMDRFGKSHPDWKTYEAEMNKLGAKVQPSADMDPQVYLEMLYLAVKKDTAIAEATGKALNKMQRSVEGAAREGGTVAANKVSQTLPTAPTFKQAADLAKRGIRLE